MIKKYFSIISTPFYLCWCYLKILCENADSQRLAENEKYGIHPKNLYIYMYDIPGFWQGEFLCLHLKCKLYQWSSYFCLRNTKPYSCLGNTEHDKMKIPLISWCNFPSVCKMFPCTSSKTPGRCDNLSFRLSVSLAFLRSRCLSCRDGSILVSETIILN